jgi:protein subunit release factor A
MESVIIEIRAAEGGDHARRLVRRQANIFRAFCVLEGIGCETLSDRL